MNGTRRRLNGRVAWERRLVWTAYAVLLVCAVALVILCVFSRSSWAEATVAVLVAGGFSYMLFHDDRSAAPPDRAARS